MRTLTVKLAIFFSVFFIAQKMDAQHNISSVLNVSPTFSGLNTKGPANAGGFKLGLDLGYNVEYWENDHLGLFSGIHLLLGQGGNIKYDSAGIYWPQLDDSLDFSGKVKHKLNYLMFPLGLKYQSRIMKGWRFWGEAQPLQVSVLLSAKSSSDELGVSKIGSRKLMNPIVIGWELGAGANYSFPKKDITVTAGISYGKSWTSVLRKNDAYPYKTGAGRFVIKLGLVKEF